MWRRAAAHGGGRVRGVPLAWQHGVKGRVNRGGGVGIVNLMGVVGVVPPANDAGQEGVRRVHMAGAAREAGVASHASRVGVADLLGVVGVVSPANDAGQEGVRRVREGQTTRNADVTLLVVAGGSAVQAACGGGLGASPAEDWGGGRMGAMRRRAAAHGGGESRGVPLAWQRGAEGRVNRGGGVGMVNLMGVMGVVPPANDAGQEGVRRVRMAGSAHDAGVTRLHGVVVGGSVRVTLGGQLRGVPLAWQRSVRGNVSGGENYRMVDLTGVVGGVPPAREAGQQGVRRVRVAGTAPNAGIAPDAGVTLLLAVVVGGSLEAALVTVYLTGVGSVIPSAHDAGQEGVRHVHVAESCNAGGALLLVVVAGGSVEVALGCGGNHGVSTRGT